MTANLTVMNISSVYSSLTNATENDQDMATMKTIYSVCLGVIIFGGLVANCLTIAVFATSKALRQSTTGVYLLALAVGDNIFLCGELLRWLDVVEAPGYRFGDVYTAACRFVVSIRYWGKLVSAWITVIITAQRYFIITFPLRAQSFLTLRKAYVGVALIFAMSFALGGIYPIFTLGVTDDPTGSYCAVTNQPAYKVLSWMFLRNGCLLLPGILILVLTVLICVKLHAASRDRSQNLQSTHSHGLDKQLTAMLLAVAVTFIVLRVPYTIAYVVKSSMTTIPRPLQLAVYSTELLSSLNYALNFFLYCLSGSTFKQQFVSMTRCRRKQKTQTTTTTTLTKRSSGTPNTLNVTVPLVSSQT